MSKRKLRIAIDKAALRARVAELIDLARGQSITGEQKHDLVVAQLAAWLDEQLPWKDRVPKWALWLAPLLEAVDGPILKLILSALVKEVYDHGKAKGWLA